MKNLFKYNVFIVLFHYIRDAWNDWVKGGTEIKHPDTNTKTFEKTDICVVYNKFSIDATLAAAVLKTNPNVLCVVDNTKVIPGNFENYLWLGIEPNIAPEGAFKELIGKVHQSIVPSTDDVVADGRQRTIFEQICEKALVNSGGLGFLIEKFYTNKLTKEESTRLYANSIHAIDVINGGVREFRVLGYSAMQDEAFKLHISGVKNKLSNAYGIQYVQLQGDRFVKAAVTCFNDDCFWALRMLKLSHKNFVNVATTLNGTLVETNIEGFEGIEVDSQIYNSKKM